jgi:hypothetical protein
MARTRSLVVATDGDLIVERDPERPTGRLLRQDDMQASYIDLADPLNLGFDYLQWIRTVLHAFAARRVLHIGGASCALPRALLAEDRESRHEVVEVDERVFQISREHLGLRKQPGLKLRVGDGRAAVFSRPDQSVDAIVLDAFVGARVPRHLATREALADCARVAPLTVINVVDTAGWIDSRAITAGLAETYPHVAGLWGGGRRGGNVIVLGSVVKPRRVYLIGALASGAYPARLMAPADLAGGAAWRDDSDPG